MNSIGKSSSRKNPIFNTRALAWPEGGSLKKHTSELKLAHKSELQIIIAEGGIRFESNKFFD